jgi:hypothetical protein
MPQSLVFGVMRLKGLKSFLSYCVLFVAACMVAACSTVSPTFQDNCLPPPAPVCNPGQFTSTLIDTTYPAQGGTYHRITMLPEFVSTHAQDFALAFIPAQGKLQAMITTSRLNAKPDGHGIAVQRMFTTTLGANVRRDYSAPLEVLTEPALTPFGSAFYSAKDQKVYLAGKAPNQDPNDFDLYVADAKWTNSELELVNVQRIAELSTSSYFDSHPTLSHDGLTLYFASDRAGGQGGVDLWYATRSSVTTTTWTKPQPLGTTINTLCDEITPHIDLNGDLLFASNGHSTVGGYDLFRAKAMSQGFDIAQNLGKPVNTKRDEFYPFALHDTAFFYASSQFTDLRGTNLYVLTKTKIPAPIVARNERPAERPSENPPQRPSREDSIRDARQAAERERLMETPATVHGQITQGNERSPADRAEIFVRDNQTQQEIDRDTVGPDGEFSLTLEKGRVYDVGAESGNTFYAYPPH